MLSDPTQISSIVFDLDGTLYTSPGLAKEIMAAAETVVAESRGLTLEKGRALLQKARERLTEDLEAEPSLTHTLVELGIEAREFHRAMRKTVRPELHLDRDPVLCALLDSLGGRYDLYIYTNNNLPVTRKILALLGAEDCFNRVYTIEFTWSPKPDPEAFQQVLEDIGGPPESFLFVGDRQQIDLDIAEDLGIPTLLVAETADLLQVHKFLGIIP